MASAGDGIKFSSFSTSYTGGQISDYDSGNNTYYDYVTCYVSAPSWWCQITINKNWGSYSREAILRAYYYTGSDWVQAWQWDNSWGWGDSGEYTYKFYHNSTLGSTSGDVSTAVLWELRFSMPELYRKRFWVYAGGIGCMGESLYNSLYKGKKIYSAGRLGSDCRHHTGGVNSADRSYALSLFSQSANTGTKITAANEEKLVGYKYC